MTTVDVPQPISSREAHYFQDFNGSDFSNKNLFESFFHQCSLQGCDFSGSNLGLVVFASCNLSRAKFTNVNHLDSALFNRCDLLGATIDDVTVASEAVNVGRGAATVWGVNTNQGPRFWHSNDSNFSFLDMERGLSRTKSSRRDSLRASIIYANALLTGHPYAD